MTFHIMYKCHQSVIPYHIKHFKFLKTSLLITKCLVLPSSTVAPNITSELHVDSHSVHNISGNLNTNRFTALTDTL